MVLQQFAHLVLLAGGHEVQHGQAPLLVQLAQQVRRVVGRHLVEHPRRLLVGTRLDELGLVLGVELLEYVGRQLGVALDGLDDLLALGMRCALDDVGDLRGMEAAQALQRHEQLGRRDVTDERLHVSPVEDRVAAQVGAAAPGHEPAQHRLRAAVDALQPPALLRMREHEIVGLHDASARDINQMAAEHVGSKQHLARSALERLRLKCVGVETHRARLELVDQVNAHEHVLRSDAHLQPRDRGIPATLRQLDDEIFDAADLGPGRVQHRAAQQLRQHQPAFLSSLARLVHVSVPFLVCH